MAKGMQRAHTPSEVNRQSQSAAGKTHEKDFGLSSMGDPMNNRPGVSLPDKQMAARPAGSGDGLGKMARGMGSQRRDMTTPATPPAPTKRATGTP